MNLGILGLFPFKTSKSSKHSAKEITEITITVSSISKTKIVYQKIIMLTRIKILGELSQMQQTLNQIS